MRVVFVSNYFNHHQKPFSDAMAALCDYTFVETGAMSEERRQMGYGMSSLPFYVIPQERFLAEPEAIQQLITDADVVILGGAPDDLFVPRLRQGKLTFRYSERLYKEGTPLRRLPHDLVSAWLHHGRFQKYPLYMLCASAYTAADAAWSGNYRGRCYKWGYFPETREYAWETLAEKKGKGPVSILWVGRMIDWKHPEAAVLTAERLKRDGFDFRIDYIGNGEMEPELRRMIADRGLEDCVHLLGAMKPEQVRDHMEQTDIFLFTSDRNEGWGAVLNEAMNSGCAVAASHAVGSVPFLLRHGENGLIFRSGDWDDLYRKVKRLIEDSALRERCGRAAYETITGEWNAKEAARRFLRLAEALAAGEDTPFTHGPCSRAEVLQDDWFKE